MTLQIGGDYRCAREAVIETQVLRIAHAHGNRRIRIEKALAAGVDLIEADVRFSSGGLWIRHERKLPFVPVLFNWRIDKFHRQGPYALSLPGIFARFESSPMSFDELIDLAGDRVGLLLDLKAAAYDAQTRGRFIDTLLRTLDSRYHGTLRFCGGRRLLDTVRERRPDQLVHYSVDRDADWDRLVARSDGGEAVRAITIRRRMLDDRRTAYLRERTIEFYTWDIETRAQAEDAIRRGTSGLISHNLDAFPDAASLVRSDAS